MRIFALSDLHIDYRENRQWLYGLPVAEYTDDVLILAGDVTHDLLELGRAFECLRERFHAVLFVPGNHDLWVRNNDGLDSFGKFEALLRVAGESGILMEPALFGDLSIVPLLGWYDNTFGEPDPGLAGIWLDYRCCAWPPTFTEREITRVFLERNLPHLARGGKRTISFSHFMPRIDIMPDIIPVSKRLIYPVLGTALLDAQIRELGSTMHVYGHSHVNRYVRKEGVVYVNNAFGYPYEERIARKMLVKVCEA